MLALFDNKVKMQPKMKEFTGLVAEKCQTPLSLIPMTEEEQRIWSKSLNSDIVMRLAGKSSVNNQNGPNSPNLNNGTAPERGGVGGPSLERGNSLDNRGLNLRNSGLRGSNLMNDRGRGRGRAGFIRNSSYEDEQANENSSGFSSGTAGENRRESYRNELTGYRNELYYKGSGEGKTTFDRPFSKPPPISSENSDTDASNRLNFRNKPQSSSLDSQQNDWRSNRLRNDNSRRNLDWRNKYRSDESNNSSQPPSEWKRNNNSSAANDRWRNDNDGDDANDLDRRFTFNNKLNKEKSSWDDHDDDKRSNLPEWSLDDDASLLDRKFGTFDASGQFREDPVDSFKDPIKDGFKEHHAKSAVDDWFMKEKVESGKLANDKKEKAHFSADHGPLSRNEHLVDSMLAKSKHFLDEKKFSQHLFEDMLVNKTPGGSSVAMQHLGKPSKGDQFSTPDDLIEAEKQKYTHNFISTLLQRQTNQQGGECLSPFDKQPSQQLKQAINEKELGEREFFDNFSLNPMVNQSTYAQQLTSHLNFNKSNQSEANNRMLLENLLADPRKQQQQQKISGNPTLDSANDKLSKLTIGQEKGKNDVQNLFDSMQANNKSQQNFSMDSELQKMFGFSETQRLLKEMSKSGSTSGSLNEQLHKQHQSVLSAKEHQRDHQPSMFKGIYPSDDQFNELDKLTSTPDSLVNQWSTTPATSQSSGNDDLKDRQTHKNPIYPSMSNCQPTVYPPNSEVSQKWYYQDPQKQVQGPFSSSDMLEWYRGNYFPMDLLVRRGCDEEFSKLGELIKSWERVPFMSASENPPMLSRNAPQQPQQQQQQPPPPQQQLMITPQLGLPSMLVQQAPQIPNQAALFQMIPPGQNEFIQQAARAANPLQQPLPIPIVALNQQQLQNQNQMLMKQQLAMDHQFLQSQLKQLLGQLKKNEQFNSLPIQEQQEILLQHYSILQNQQLLHQQKLNQQQQTTAVNIPICQPPPPAASQPPTISQAPQPRPPNQQPTQPSQQPPPQQQPKPQTSQSSNGDAQQVRSELIGSTAMNPMIKQILSKGGQPNLWGGLNGEQVMTVTAIEEMQRQEQDRREIEEKRKQIEQEEQRRLEELQIMKQLEEQERIRNRDKQLYEEEMRSREEERKRLKKLEEQTKLREEEERLVLLESKRKEKELEQQMIKKQITKQKQLEASHQKQLEQLQQQSKIESGSNYQQQQPQAVQQPVKQQQKKKGWAVIATDSVSSEQPTSLDEIQKLQESTEREERLKQTQQMLQMIQDNQKAKGWSNVMNKPIKTLDEIQREESERMARMKKQEEESQPLPPPPSVNVGVWATRRTI